MAVVKLLIVDDEASMRSALTRALRCQDCDITVAADGAEAVAILEQQLPVEFSVAIVDLCMPQMDGLELLVEIRRRSPATQVLILTGKGTVADAVRAMRLGADDFLEKPFDPDVLRKRVRTAQRLWSVKRTPAQPCSSGDPVDGFQNLLGQSPRMQRIRRLAQRLGVSDAMLLIQGESGTGKEQFARAVHFGGKRSRDPLVAIDLASISPTILESELFGHAKGAFTNAIGAREGLIRSAGKGTVFLDEIGELPLNMQTTLLRVIQEREVRPVGNEAVLPVEARLIAATNRNLADAVRRGEFREDLYHRLNVIEVTLPRLRDRKEDIPALAERFLAKFNDERPAVTEISDDALALLTEHDWPGNVRELENAVLRALVVGTSEVIEVKDLPLQVRESIAGGPLSGSTARPPDKSGFHSARGSESGTVERSSAVGTLASHERDAIVAALEETDGNRRRAAEILDIGVATLYRKLKRYDIR